MDLFLIPLYTDIVLHDDDSKMSQYVLDLVAKLGVRKAIYDSTQYMRIYSQMIEYFDIDKTLETFTSSEDLDKLWENVNSAILKIEKLDETLAENFRFGNSLIFKQLGYVLKVYPFLFDQMHLHTIKDFKNLESLSQLGTAHDLVSSNVFGSSYGISYYLELAQYLIQLYLAIKIVYLVIHKKINISQQDLNVLSHALQSSGQKILPYLPAFFP